MYVYTHTQYTNYYTQQLVEGFCVQVLERYLSLSIVLFLSFIGSMVILIL